MCASAGPPAGGGASGATVAALALLVAARSYEGDLQRMREPVATEEAATPDAPREALA